MSHTFLLEPGSWIINGLWIDRNQNQSKITGATIIKWDVNLFTNQTKLIFPNGELPEITYEDKGLLAAEQEQYTYVLKHNELGKIEGEGWIGNDSIVQRYWVLGDNRRRSGFETFYLMDESTYHLSSAILMGNHLHSTMEAILERC